MAPDGTGWTGPGFKSQKSGEQNSTPTKPTTSLNLNNLKAQGANNSPVGSSTTQSPVTPLAGTGNAKSPDTTVDNSSNAIVQQADADGLMYAARTGQVTAVDQHKKNALSDPDKRELEDILNAKKPAKLPQYAEEEEEEKKSGLKLFAPMALGAASALKFKPPRLHIFRQLRRLIKWAARKGREFGERLADRAKRARGKETLTPEERRAAQAKREAHEKRVEAAEARERIKPGVADGAEPEAIRLEREAKLAEQRAVKLEGAASHSKPHTPVMPKIGDHLSGAMHDTRNVLRSNPLRGFVAIPAVAAAFVWFTAPKAHATTTKVADSSKAFGNTLLPPDVRKAAAEAEGGYATKFFTGAAKFFMADKIAAGIQRANKHPDGAAIGAMSELMDLGKTVVGGTVRIAKAIEKDPKVVDEVRQAVITGSSDSNLVTTTAQETRGLLTGSETAEQAAQPVASAILANQPLTGQVSKIADTVSGASKQPPKPSIADIRPPMAAEKPKPATGSSRPTAAAPSTAAPAPEPDRAG